MSNIISRYFPWAREHQSGRWFFSNNTGKQSAEDSYPLLDQSRETRSSLSDNELEPPKDEAVTPANEPVTWSSLPNKRQLAILVLLKALECAGRAVYRVFLYHQLKWFDPSLPDSTISAQAGIIQGSSAVIQVLSSVTLGRLADTARIGRKNILLLGSIGFAVSSLALAFSRSFLAAAISLAVGGALNGNAGLMRTVLSESLTDKRYQSRAFLLLPLSGSLGGTIGSLMGGALADPVHSFPGVFGPNSVLGGRDGVGWMSQWPYALPNVVSALVCTCAAAMVTFGVDETHEVARHRVDWGRRMGKAIARRLCARHKGYRYQSLSEDGPLDRVSGDAGDSRSISSSLPSTTSQSPGFWTLLRMPNVLLTMCLRFLFVLHFSTHDALCLIFLPSPRAAPSTRHGIHFGGGLGLPSAQVGVAISITSLVYLPLSLIMYPWMAAWMGPLRMLNIFLSFALVMYGLFPLLVLIPGQGGVLWATLAALMVLKAIFNTFSNPSCVILLNNCVSDPNVLATVHGLGQSVSSAAGALGPVIGGWGLGLGLKYNLVGGVWWGLVAIGMMQWVVAWPLKEVA